MLPVLAPVVDLFTLFGVLFLEPLPLVGFWVAFNLLGLALALYASRLDHERPGVLWAFVAQQFVYRQLMYLVVVQAAVTAGLGATLRWHKLERTGGVTTAG